MLRKILVLLFVVYCNSVASQVLFIIPNLPVNFHTSGIFVEQRKDLHRIQRIRPQLQSFSSSSQTLGSRFGSDEESSHVRNFPQKQDNLMYGKQPEQISWPPIVFRNDGNNFENNKRVDEQQTTTYNVRNYQDNGYPSNGYGEQLGSQGSGQLGFNSPKITTIKNQRPTTYPGNIGSSQTFNGNQQNQQLDRNPVLHSPDTAQNGNQNSYQPINNYNQNQSPVYNQDSSGNTNYDAYVAPTTTTKKPLTLVNKQNLPNSGATPNSAFPQNSNNNRNTNSQNANRNNAETPTDFRTTKQYKVQTSTFAPVPVQYDQSNQRPSMLQHVDDEDKIVLPNQREIIELVPPPALNFNDDVYSTTRASLLELIRS